MSKLIEHMIAVLLAGLMLTSCAGPAIASGQVLAMQPGATIAPAPPSARRGERKRSHDRVNQLSTAAVRYMDGSQGYTGWIAGTPAGGELMDIIPEARWYAIKDGDPRGRDMLNRHYSARHYKDGRRPKLFVGPGEKIVLMTSDSRALFVWRKFISDDGQVGVNCAVFRNEGEILSSDLIREAMELAWQKWPGERLYTYVDPGKVNSTNPGYCFLQAGWRRCGKTKRGKRILEALP